MLNSSHGHLNKSAGLKTCTCEKPGGRDRKCADGNENTARFDNRIVILDITSVSRVCANRIELFFKKQFVETIG